MDLNLKENEAVLTDAPQKKGIDLASAFSHPLFWVMCIFFTLSVISLFIFCCIFPILFTRALWMIFPLLFMIALWITFSSAKAKKSPASGMEFTNGIIVVKYWINYISTGICAFFGLGMSMLATFFYIAGYNDITVIDLAKGFATLFVKISNVMGFGDVLFRGFNGYNIEKVEVVICDIAIFFIVRAVIKILFNVFFTRQVRIFSKSLCESEERNENLVEKAVTAKNWLMAIGVIYAVFAALITVILILVCSSEEIIYIFLYSLIYIPILAFTLFKAVAFIISSVWVKRNFAYDNCGK